MKPVFEIDLRGSMYSCMPRMVWQQLFNYYRSFWGDLNDIDNLLIDLDNIRLALEKVYIEDRPSIEFLWGFHKWGQTIFHQDINNIGSVDDCISLEPGMKWLIVEIVKGSVKAYLAEEWVGEF